jgi:hypothetical protein
MVSIGWLLAAFLGGGAAGVLLMAVIYMSGPSEESPTVVDLRGSATKWRPGWPEEAAASTAETWF